MRKAQTSTEYLIILAVVILIALVVTQLLGGFPRIGEGVNVNSQKAKLKTISDVGITDWYINTAGTKIKFQNNVPNSVQLNSIHINTTFIPVNKILKTGETYIIEEHRIIYSSPTTYEIPIIINYTDLNTNANFVVNKTDLKIVGKSTIGTMDFVGSGTFHSTLGGLNMDFSDDLIPSPVPDSGVNGVYFLKFITGNNVGNLYNITSSSDLSSWTGKDFFTISPTFSGVSMGDTFVVFKLRS